VSLSLHAQFKGLPYLFYTDYTIMEVKVI
jgi:hypothetical protein